MLLARRVEVVWTHLGPSPRLEGQEGLVCVEQWRQVLAVYDTIVENVVHLLPKGHAGARVRPSDHVASRQSCVEGRRLLGLSKLDGVGWTPLIKRIDRLKVEENTGNRKVPDLRARIAVANIDFRLAPVDRYDELGKRVIGGGRLSRKGSWLARSGRVNSCTCKKLLASFGVGEPLERAIACELPLIRHRHPLRQ